MTTRMAILGTRGVPAQYGGYETFAEEIGSRLASRGVEVTVLCPRTDGVTRQEYRGIRLAYVKPIGAGALGTLSYDVRSLLATRRDYDVVYLLGYAAALFAAACKPARGTLWVNPDGIEWLRRKWGWFARRYLRAMESWTVAAADRIIADSYAIGDHFRRRHRSLPKLDVIPYGAPIIENPPNPRPLRELGLNPGEYHLIVGRLEPENNILPMVRGHALSGSHLPLVIVGNHDRDTRYIRQLKAVAGPRVFFAGGIYERARLQALRFYATAYLHGHSVGGTNPSLLEALGCGNIVLAHDNPFNREVAGWLGFYFTDPKDVSDLVTEIENMGSEERTERVRAAHARVKSQYDWDAITDAYELLLHSL